MFLLSLFKISKITNAILIGKNLFINSISVDTRVNNIENSLFIIIKGKSNIDFICSEAIKKGALAILSDFFFSIHIPLLIVKNSKLALENLVIWLRKKVNTKFLCLTGSTGKTSVKEITANILSQTGSTLFNYSNLNNELGVCFTLLKLYKYIYKYAVLEFGANNVNDINYLSNLVKPDVACITNICVSHLSGFKNFLNIIKSKGKIFKYLSTNGIVVLNYNYYLNNFWNKYIFNKKKIFILFNGSIKRRNCISVYDIKITIWGSYFTLVSIYGNINIFIKLLGIHNIWNSLLASSLSISVNTSLKDIKIGLESCKPIKGRLYPIFLNKNKLILDDTYNSNPRSLYYSVLFLQKCIGYKILVIGDMEELSYMSIYYHIEIGKLIKNFFNIDKIFSIGKYSFYISKYSFIGEHFENFDKLIIRIKYMLKIYDQITILIKGSRVANMQKIINFL